MRASAVVCALSPGGADSLPGAGRIGREQALEAEVTVGEM